MGASSIGARAILVAVAAALCAFASVSSPGDESKGPAAKAPVLTLDEKYEKLEGGILKSTGKMASGKMVSAAMPHSRHPEIMKTASALGILDSDTSPDKAGIYLVL